MTENRSLTIGLAILFAVALASFATGHWFSYLGSYMLIQFLLAGAWLVAAVCLLLPEGRARGLMLWSLVVLAGIVGLFIQRKLDIYCCPLGCRGSYRAWLRRGRNR